MHFPSLHLPRSWQSVLSAIGGLLGHSAWCPVQRDSCSQVAYWASLHLAPALMYWQCWQHGEFLSLKRENFKNLDVTRYWHLWLSIKNSLLKARNLIEQSILYTFKFIELAVNRKFASTLTNFFENEIVQILTCTPL